MFAHVWALLIPDTCEVTINFQESDLPNCICSLKNVIFNKNIHCQ